jgi:hypothetical protein
VNIDAGLPGNFVRIAEIAPPYTLETKIEIRNRIASDIVEELPGTAPSTNPDAVPGTTRRSLAGLAT